MNINIYHDDEAVVLWPSVTVGRDFPGHWFVELDFWRWAIVWRRWKEIETEDDDVEHMSPRATVIDLPIQK